MNYNNKVKLIINCLNKNRYLKVHEPYTFFNIVVTLIHTTSEKYKIMAVLKTDI